MNFSKPALLAGEDLLGCLLVVCLLSACFHHGVSFLDHSGQVVALAAWGPGARARTYCG